MGERFRVAPEVAQVRSDRDDGPVVHLLVLPDGPFVELVGPAALIWEAAIAAETDDVVASVASAAGVTVAVVERQVEAFVAELCARSLLEPVDDGE